MMLCILECQNILTVEILYRRKPPVDNWRLENNWHYIQTITKLLALLIIVLEDDCSKYTSLEHLAWGIHIYYVYLFITKA